MANTEHYGIPKPDPAANVDDEFIRLQTAWDMLDAILFTLQGVIAGKASVGHGHEIEDIIGLAAALAGKMPSSRTFSLSDLTDVEGAAAAPVNYVLVKNASGKWVPSTAIAAIGEHQHPMTNIVGLVDTLLDLQTQISNRATIADLQKAIPAGAIVSFPMVTPPTGWLKANGALLPRASYTSLFAAIGTFYGAGDGATTFQLPDYRGEFIRGLDDGRGVDPGRGIGSAQASQNLLHNHTYTDTGHGHGGSTSASGDHVHQSGGMPTGALDGNQGYGLPKTAGYANVVWVTQMGAQGTGPAGNHAHSIATSASLTGITINNSGGNEARPRNVAALTCIKY